MWVAGWANHPEYSPFGAARYVLRVVSASWHLCWIGYASIFSILACAVMSFQAGNYTSSTKYRCTLSHQLWDEHLSLLNWVNVKVFCLSSPFPILWCNFVVSPVSHSYDNWLSNLHLLSRESVSLLNSLIWGKNEADLCLNWTYNFVFHSSHPLPPLPLNNSLKFSDALPSSDIFGGL